MGMQTQNQNHIKTQPWPWLRSSVSSSLHSSRSQAIASDIRASGAGAA